MTFTKEQLIEQAKNNLIGLKNYVTVYPERADSEAMNIRLAEIALASLEAEPVACPKCNDTGMADSGGVQPWGEPISVPCDCTAQPALAVDADDNFYSWFGREWHDHYQQNKYTTAAKQMLGVMAESAWKAGRRAAMLQGSQPVSNRDELPLDYLHGHKDGLEWAAQLAEANHPHTGDWLYDDPLELAKAIRKGPDMPAVEAGNSPVIPDGYVLVPKKLTAENGAKSVLSGEFSETKFINCPECFGDDDCETCDGSGRIEITVPVTWTTIKDIWDKVVEHFAAAPQQEAE